MDGSLVDAALAPATRYLAGVRTTPVFWAPTERRDERR
jgi:hypothetical protein